MKKHLGRFALVAAPLLLFGVGECLAKAGSPVQTFGSMATMITSSFGQLAQLITAGSYIAGIGFSLGAIMKFKAHKDNPTQVQIGTPIAMTFIAAALLFFPTILAMTGQSIFGTTVTAGTAGTAWGGGG